MSTTERITTALRNIRRGNQGQHLPDPTRVITAIQIGADPLPDLADWLEEIATESWVDEIAMDRALALVESFEGPPCS